MELERENISRSGGGMCCWCVGLYLLLLTCFIVLMAMMGIYFGYNMIRLSNDYKQRITSLEGRVDTLEKNLAGMKAASNTRMDVMSHSLTVVNDSMHQLDTKLTSHSSEVKHTLDGVEKSLGDIRDRMAAFESHPSTIGEDEVSDMRNSMAEFRGHLESYDAQLADVKRDAGDATLKVTKVDEKVQVLQGNVTSLKSTLSNVQSNHRETVDNLDLLTTRFTALQVVVQDMNDTVLREVNLTRNFINETNNKIETVEEKLAVVSDHVDTLSDDVESFNKSLDQIIAAESESASNVPVPVTEPTATTVANTPVKTEPATMTTQSTTMTTQSTTMTTEPTTTPEPVTTEPVTTEPVTTEPVTTEPVTTEPVTTEPVTTEPASTEPVTTEPASTEPPTEISIEPETEPSMATTLPTEITAPSVSQDNITIIPVETTEESSVNITDASTMPSEASLNSTSPLSSPDVTPDSTEATEDFPSSTDSSSDQGSSVDSIPEEQPPTVDDRQKGIQDTISKLNTLLVQFDLLDTNNDTVLDYNEFTIYGGNTESAKGIFRLMDSNIDRISYQEISDTIQMLQLQITEGTEDMLNGENGQYNEGDVPDTQTQPVAATTPVNTTPEAETDPVLETTGTQPDEDSLSMTVSTTTTPTETSNSEDEMERAIEALKTLTDIMDKFDDIDIYHDRHLSDIEFSLYFPENNAMVSHIFKYLDVDGDSFISYDELSNAVDSLRKKIAPEETTLEPEEELAEILNGGTNV